MGEDGIQNRPQSSVELIARLTSPSASSSLTERAS